MNPRNNTTSTRKNPTAPEAPALIPIGDADHVVLGFPWQVTISSGSSRRSSNSRRTTTMAGRQSHRFPEDACHDKMTEPPPYGTPPVDAHQATRFSQWR